MTGYSETLAPRPRSGAIMASLIIVVPIALALICVLARFDIIELSQSLRAVLLFAMLLGLMATGMPISIALGLSVLTYLFILSSVDPKMVGLSCSPASTASRSWRSRSSSWRQFPPPAGWRGA